MSFFKSKILYAVALVLMLGLAGCVSSGPELKVLSEKEYELGDDVSLKPESFLLDEQPESVLDEIEVDSVLTDPAQYNVNEFTDTVTSQGMDYLVTGTYDVTLKYKGKSYPTKIVVKDTTIPEFVSPAAVVTIPLGTEDFDFSAIYQTSDKDTVTLSVEGDYDPNTAGKYPVTLVATDASGNTNSLEITINVISDNQPISASNQFADEEAYDGKTDPSTSVIPSGTDDQNSTVPEPDDSTEAEQPSDSAQTPVPTDPTACPVSSAPEGTEIYRTFQEAYNAGTAWNQQSPYNYFYYVEGTDDCGQKVYIVTLSSAQSEEDGIH